MNPFFTSFFLVSLGLGCLSPGWVFGTELGFRHGESLHVETTDGLALYGMVADATGETLHLETSYGSLDIPYGNIRRLNGDLFVPGQGLVHEIKLTFLPNDGLLQEYLHPLTLQPQPSIIQLLLPGTPLSIQDPDGGNLSFTSMRIGRFSRAQVNLPARRIAGVQIQMRIEEALSGGNHSLAYVFRYIPAWDQELRLSVILPEGYTLEDPGEPVETLTGLSYLYKKKLSRQENLEWTMTAVSKP